MSRIAAILEAVAANDRGLRLIDLTKLIGAPKTSLYGFIRGLVAIGYLAESDGLYTLGAGLGILIERMAPERVMVAARPELRRLVELTNETAVVGVRVGNSIVYLESLPSPSRIQYVPPILQRRPLLHNSIGKLYLAEMADVDVRRLMDEMMPEYTDEEFASLLGELRTIKATGVSFNNIVNESAEVLAVASAVWGRGGIMAGIAVAGPRTRLVTRRDELAEYVRASAVRASLPTAPVPA